MTAATEFKVSLVGADRYFSDLSKAAELKEEGKAAELKEEVKGIGEGFEGDDQKGDDQKGGSGFRRRFSEWLDKLYTVAMNIWNFYFARITPIEHFNRFGTLIMSAFAIIGAVVYIKDDHDYKKLVDGVTELQSFVTNVSAFIKDEKELKEGEGISLVEIRAIPFKMNTLSENNEH